MRLTLRSPTHGTHSFFAAAADVALACRKRRC